LEPSYILGSLPREWNAVSRISILKCLLDDMMSDTNNLKALDLPEYIYVIIFVIN
jgi:hypothetical protein